MEKRKRDKLSIMGIPDEQERQRKAVDFKVRGTSAEYVLEHTQIESFPQQIEDNHQFVDLLNPLKDELTGILPRPGHYILSVAPRSLDGVKNSERNSIRESLKIWIKSKAPSLLIGSPSTAPKHFICEKPPGVPFEVTLYRWPRRDGQLFISRSVPEELEEKRRLRIRRALNDKCPKLQKERGKDLVSVLILESDDIALANYSVIAQAVIPELSNRKRDLPDEVYLIETEIEPLAVWILKEGKHLFPDIEDAGPHYIIPQEPISSERTLSRNSC